MVVSVNERSSEIGLRLAIGATPVEILGMFLFEGFVLILTAGCLGIVAGYFLTQGILKPLPTMIPDYEGWEFTFSAMALIKTMTLLIIAAFLGGFLPAWKACRMEPIQALRHE